MKFFLLLLVFGLHSGIYAGNEPTTLNGSGHFISEKKEALQIDEQDFDKNPAALLAHLKQTKNRPQSGQHPFARFINSKLLITARNVSLVKTTVTQPQYYCRSIGLLLLFPKHYFW